MGCLLSWYLVCRMRLVLLSERPTTEDLEASGLDITDIRRARGVAELHAFCRAASVGGVSSVAILGDSPHDMVAALEAAETVPTVVYTELDSLDHAKIALSCGATDYVIVGPDPTVLRKAVLLAEHRWLMRRKLEEAACNAERLSGQDALTGLYNRRGAEGLLHRAPRGMPYTAVLIDVDDFKAYNETLGYVAGDETLKSVANVLLGGLRYGDFASRIGGDEFLVVMPGLSDPDTAQGAGARLVEAIGAAGVPVSAGVSVCDFSQLDKVIASTQWALATSKRAGKGRCSSAC